MATFRICLVGPAQQLTVDFTANDISELADAASRSRFLVGHMLEPDEDGVCAGVMISTGRIQCVFEA